MAHHNHLANINDGSFHEGSPKQMVLPRRLAKIIQQIYAIDYSHKGLQILFSNISDGLSR